MKKLASVDSVILPSRTKIASKARLMVAFCLAKTSGKRFKESARYMLDPSLGNFGCVVPAGAWHTVEVLEPSVIFEAKDGKYGEDRSESLADYDNKAKATSTPPFINSLGDLKKNIEYIIGMERQSGNIDTPTPQDIAHILNVSVEEVEQCMKEISL